MNFNVHVFCKMILCNKFGFILETSLFLLILKIYGRKKFYSSDTLSFSESFWHFHRNSLSTLTSTCRPKTTQDVKSISLLVGPPSVSSGLVQAGCGRINSDHGWQLKSGKRYILVCATGFWWNWHLQVQFNTDSFTLKAKYLYTRWLVRCHGN